MDKIVDTRGEDNPLWEPSEELPVALEMEAKSLYVLENLDLVDSGAQSGFVGWFDTTRGIRDIYRRKVMEVD